jgi:integrase
MATIKAFIRSTGPKALIRLRLSAGRKCIFYGITPIEISPSWWNPEKEELKARLLLPGDASRDEINARIRAAKDTVLAHFLNNQPTDKDWITSLLASAIPSNAKGRSADPVPDEATDVLTLFDRFIHERQVSPGRRRHLEVVRTMIDRFSRVNGKSYRADNFPGAAKFEEFLREEHTISLLHPAIYPQALKARGMNTVNSKLKILSAFFHWARGVRATTNNPFDGYTFPREVYGDPVPLTTEEVNTLLQSDLSGAMATIRDMFCLQCFTGCRIGDFRELRKENLVDGVITYIPSKTVADNPTPVFVPLPEVALTIIERLGYPDGYLVPRINVTGKAGYSKKIKQMVEDCGIDRAVTVIDTLTRKPVTRMLSQVISTHTARRTFINSNYKQTQDPALIGMMSGHSPTSRAFSRYRNIDMDILKQQIKKVFG